MPVSYHGFNNMSLLDKAEPTQGVALTYKSATACAGSKTYGLRIEVICNKDVFRTKY